MVPIPLLVFHLAHAFGKAKLDNEVKQSCLLKFQEIFTLQWPLVKQYGGLKLVHFTKKTSLRGPLILIF